MSRRLPRPPKAKQRTAALSGASSAESAETSPSTDGPSVDPAFDGPSLDAVPLDAFQEAGELTDGSLFDFGYNEQLAAAFAEATQQKGQSELGRVISVHYGGAFVVSDRGRLLASPSGVLARAIREDHRMRPVVGDWVVIRSAQSELEHARVLIDAVLPRHNELRRQVDPERDEVQVLCSNIDALFIFVPCDQPVLAPTIERYIALCRGAQGAQIALLASKADLKADAIEHAQALTREFGVDAYAVDCHSGMAAGKALFGLHEPATSSSDQEPLATTKAAATAAVSLRKGQAVAMLGPSGSGKSTLLNTLSGSRLQRTQDTRAGDHKGRHTTTHRQLFRLPSGILLMDTPGLREVSPALETREPFPEIAAVAKNCRFANCTHQNEPGCAVQRAIREGTLRPGRLKAYHALLDRSR
jgi:ribosome biogenesis GTPase / thiamine phosphate phosphatase